VFVCFALFVIVFTRRPNCLFYYCFMFLINCSHCVLYHFVDSAYPEGLLYIIFGSLKTHLFENNLFCNMSRWICFLGRVRNNKKSSPGLEDAAFFAHKKGARKNNPKMQRRLRTPLLVYPPHPAAPLTRPPCAGTV